MDAIMFSANPSMVRVDDAIRHLADHNQLYWEVGFRIDPDNFSYPLMGFIHIKGGQIEYKVTIREIKDFSPEHYENQDLAERVKPEPWLREWEQNLNNIRSYPWKFALVITEIEPFSCDTYKFSKYDGSPIQRPPQSYVRVLPPGKSGGGTIIGSSEGQLGAQRAVSVPSTKRTPLAEVNLEEFVVHQLEKIEPGLRLVDRQLPTDAGRLDLLCKDQDERYVVVELKRAQGTDQVVGQILRYMGWVLDYYQTDKVRGIIIVGKKTPALTYAIKAVPNIQVKEFKLSIK
jgi:hypothetical protein